MRRLAHVVVAAEAGSWSAVAAGNGLGGGVATTAVDDGTAEGAGVAVGAAVNVGAVVGVGAVVAVGAAAGVASGTTAVAVGASGTGAHAPSHNVRITVRMISHAGLGFMTSLPG